MTARVLSTTEPSLNCGLTFETIEGVVDFSRNTMDATLSTCGLGQPDPIGRLVVDGARSYIQPVDQPSKGPSWVRLDDSGSPAGEIDDPLPDPVMIARQLTETANRVVKTGAGEVRGDPTETYQLELPAGWQPTNFLLAAMGSEDEVQSAVMDVDADGRLRRLAVTAPEGARARPDIPFDPGPTTTTVEFWDFGVAVDVDAPDPGDVVDQDSARGGELSDALFDEDASWNKWPDFEAAPEFVRRANQICRQGNEKVDRAKAALPPGSAMTAEEAQAFATEWVAPSAIEALAAIEELEVRQDLNVAVVQLVEEGRRGLDRLRQLTLDDPLALWNQGADPFAEFREKAEWAGLDQCYLW